MKYLKFLVISVIVLFCVMSCEKETAIKEADIAENSEVVAPVIKAYTPEDGTKVYVDGVVVKWQQNDKLTVLNDTVFNRTWSYQLTSGAGTNEGTFTCSSGSGAIPSNTSVHAFYFKDYGWYKDKYYFDIEPNPTLYGYVDTTSSVLGNTLKIPMMAAGTITSEVGDGFRFGYLASLLRLKIKNTFKYEVTVNSIQILATGKGYPSRRYAIDPQNWAMTVYELQNDQITAKGSVSIKPDSTKFFDFVISSEAYEGFTVSVATSNQYDANNPTATHKFSKADFTAKKGHLHPFLTKLDSTSMSHKKYMIIIDGGVRKEYNIGDEINPKTSIKIEEGDTNIISKTEYKTLLNNLGTGTGLLDLDVSELTCVDGTTWSDPLGNNRVSKLRLPSNITTISGQTCGLQNGARNIKWIVGKDINAIANKVFNYQNMCISDTCGFFVDNANTTYSSDAGILYDKEDTTLIQYPSFERTASGISVKSGVKVIAAYAISNNSVLTSVTLPASVTKINSGNFESTGSLTLITVKSATPPELNTKIGFGYAAASGKIVVDTGGDDDNSKTLYQNAWNGKYDDTCWQIITSAEYQQIKSSPSLTNLSLDSGYKTGLW